MRKGRTTPETPQRSWASISAAVAGAPAAVKASATWLLGLLVFGLVMDRGMTFFILFVAFLVAAIAATIFAFLYFGTWLFEKLEDWF